MDKLDPVLSAVGAYFGMLAELSRLKIMHAICAGERTVSEIVAETGITQTNVSRQLGLLHRHGLVERRREGNHIHYRIADETMPELCRAVCIHLARKMDEGRLLKRQLLEFTSAR